MLHKFKHDKQSQTKSFRCLHAHNLREDDGVDHTHENLSAHKSHAEANGKKIRD